MPSRYSKLSPFTDIMHTMEFDLYEQDEFEKRYIAWQSGKVCISDAFPELSLEARRFIQYGVTEIEWIKYMGEEQ